MHMHTHIYIYMYTQSSVYLFIHTYICSSYKGFGVCGLGISDLGYRMHGFGGLYNKLRLRDLKANANNDFRGAWCNYIKKPSRDSMSNSSDIVRRPKH